MDFFLILVNLGIICYECEGSEYTNCYNKPSNIVKCNSSYNGCLSIKRRRNRKFYAFYFVTYLLRILFIF